MAFAILLRVFAIAAGLGNSPALCARCCSTNSLRRSAIFSTNAALSNVRKSSRTFTLAFLASAMLRFLPLDELSLYWQFVAGKAHGFPGNFLGYPLHLKHHGAGFNLSGKIFWVTFTTTHFY